ncbi:MAG TPA: hypothetical protein VL357_10970 [Rariglobus sp.]|jgi:hypothetical protein|nr:hypothetical protein [Rariglobus sp.]
MKNRVLAFSAILATALTLVLNGAGQFGYPYFGFLGALGAALKTLLQFSEWAAALYFFSLLLEVIILSLYVGSILTVLSALILLLFKKEDPIARYRMEPKGLFMLSISMIAGLILAKVFPRDQIPPLSVPRSYFIYPFIILVISVLLNIKKKVKTE